MSSSTRTDKSRALHLGPERRRPLVLDAALAVWLERGYAGTTMNAIAEAAGVTKPVLYECFDSKDDVLRNLLKREELRLLDAVADALPRELDFDDLTGLLTASYTAFFTATSQSPDSWRLVFEAQLGVPDAIAHRIRRERASIVAQIQQMVLLFLSSRDELNAGRDSGMIAESLVSLAESGARILLADDPANPQWTPEDLGGFTAKGLLRSWI